MKVLLAIDGSPHSDAAIVDVARGSWPDETAIEILSVIHASAPLVVDPAIVMAAVYVEQIEERWHRPTKLVNAARDRIEGDAWGVQVTTKIIEGNPRDVILAEAREWGADLVVVGAGGYDGPRRVVLGSVAGAVVAHAPCSVQVVRPKQGAGAGRRGLQADCSPVVARPNLRRLVSAAARRTSARSTSGRHGLGRNMSHPASKAPS